MMSAPVARTASGFIALTVAAVPTGMNAGVRISPRRIAMRPVRALPSRASMVNWKRVIGAAYGQLGIAGRSEAVDEREAGQRVGRNRAHRRVAVIVNRVRQAGGQAVADLRLEAGRQQRADGPGIDEDRRFPRGVGHQVCLLGEPELLGELPVEIEPGERAEAAVVRTS